MYIHTESLIFIFNFF